MERVLVLGSTGFLGPHVVAALRRDSSARVVGASRRKGPSELGPSESEPSRAALPRGAAAPHERLDCDLAEPGAAEACLERARPDAVVLLAALSRGARCEREPEVAARVNADAPGRVAAWCERRGVALVHVSTDLVFGGDAPEGGYPEDAEPRPLHVYGRTKAEGEAAVLAARPAAQVVRLPLLLGSSFGRGLGASDALLAALARGESPRLFVDEWRTPLAAEDAGLALAELARRLAAGELPGGRLHVAGPERLTRHALGRVVLEAAGRGADAARLVEARRAELGLVPPRPRDVSLDAGRARALLRTELRAPFAALSAAPPAP